MLLFRVHQVTFSLRSTFSNHYQFLIGTCDQFITCVNGAQAGEIRTCANEFHFNPAIGSCDFPANLVTPCTAAANMRYTPKAPEITRMPSFRERLAKKLHL